MTKRWKRQPRVDPRTKKRRGKQSKKSSDTTEKTAEITTTTAAATATTTAAAATTTVIIAPEEIDPDITSETICDFDIDVPPDQPAQSTPILTASERKIHGCSNKKSSNVSGTDMMKIST